MVSHYPPQPPQPLPQPLPVDLIVAARDVIAAFGGDVPDWINSQIAMLGLALKPFENVVPMPQEKPLALGDTLFLRHLEQRDRIVINSLVDMAGTDDLRPEFASVYFENVEVNAEAIARIAEKRAERELRETRYNNDQCVECGGNDDRLADQGDGVCRKCKDREDDNG